MVFTGERFLPELDIDSEIAIFHYQRYRSVFDVCKGKIVLDAACGEGYGSNMLASVAQTVYGVDIDHKTIEAAKAKYYQNNLTYLEGSIEKLEFEDSIFDVVISFETIEHVDDSVQKKFINEIHRVLKPDGVLIMSSPDKLNYSDITGFKNEFHIKELYFEEFERLLRGFFRNINFYYQGRLCNSYIFDPKKSVKNINKEIRLRNADKTQAEYIIAVCSNREVSEEIESVIFDVDNRYYRLNRQIAELKKEIGHPGDIIEQKENYINEQRRMLEKRDNEIREINGIIEQKENYINEQRRILEKCDNYINEQRELINMFELFVGKRGIRKLYALFLKRNNKRNNKRNGDKQ